MVEQTSNTDGIVYRKVDLSETNPTEHTAVILEYGQENDVDIDQYLTGYSFEVLKDTANSFYGKVRGNHPVIDDFDPLESQKRRDMVKDRLGWLSTFVYTPEEIQVVVKSFLNEFVSIEDSLNSYDGWVKITEKWRNVLNNKEGVVYRLMNEVEYKNMIDYYGKKLRQLQKENEERGLRVT